MLAESSTVSTRSLFADLSFQFLKRLSNAEKPIRPADREGPLNGRRGRDDDQSTPIREQLSGGEQRMQRRRVDELDRAEVNDQPFRPSTTLTLEQRRE